MPTNHLQILTTLSTGPGHAWIPTDLPTVYVIDPDYIDQRIAIVVGLDTALLSFDGQIIDSLDYVDYDDESDFWESVAIALGV